MIVTVDMDDTLIKTSQDYVNSAEEFGEYMNSEFGIEPEEAVKTQNEEDYKLLDEYGIQQQRYPNSFINALQELVDNPSQQHINDVEQIGYSTYKTESVYADRGFMAGAEEMLNTLESLTDNLYLVTVGDPTVQQPKINALNLNKWFDETFIPSHSDGKESVFSTLISNHSKFTAEQLIHIGNSASSDVSSVLDVGGNAVYISEEVDWLSDNATHKEYIHHDKVYPYNTATGFIPDIEDILSNHR